MATTADTLKRTNEQPGTRAKLKNLRTSAYKVREVLDIIRGEDVQNALDILRFCERGPAEPIAKLLNSAIANAVENDGMDRNELFVTACFADEAPTIKRFKPRARGRAGKIRKRGSHITIIVARLPEDRLERLRAEQAEQGGGRGRRVADSRAARVAGGRKAANKEVAADEVVDEAIESEEITTEATPAPAEAEVTTTEASEVTPEDATNEEEK